MPWLRRASASLPAESYVAGAPASLGRKLGARTRALSVCIAAGALAASVLLLPPLFSWQENADLYVLFRARGKLPPPDNVVMVPIDRRASDSLAVPKDPQAFAACSDLLVGATLPATHERLVPPHQMSHWPRCIMARTVQALHRAGAAAIVLDVVFRPRPAQGRSNELLAQALREAGNVIVAQRIEGEREEPAPSESMIASASLGEAPLLLSRSNMTYVHRYYALERADWDNVSMPLLALQLRALADYPVLRSLLVAEQPELDDLLPRDLAELRAQGQLQTLALMIRGAMRQRGDLAAHLLRGLDRPDHADMTPAQREMLRALIRAYAGSSERYFNFRGPPGTLQAVRLEKLLGADALPDLRGKTVFVGLAEYGYPEQYEHFPTVWQSADGFDHAGVELAATAFSNLLEDDSVVPVAPWAGALIVFALGASVAWVCFFYTSRRALLIVLAIASLYLAIALLAFEHHALWLPLSGAGFAVVMGLVLAFVTQHIELKHQYGALYGTLGMFVPRGVIERLVNNAERLAWIGDTAFGACVATDGERYTALADQLSPLELSRFLNRYFQTLFPPVASREGWISDVVGDSMLAVWAEARPSARVRSQACQAALEMSIASERFNEMPTRIGIDFGPIALTTLGAGTHWEYRPVGAVPNTANRLQALNKLLGTRLLVSEAVVVGLEDFAVRDLGWFLLRGKESPTRVLELIAERAHASAEQLQLCELFAIALQRFQLGDAHGAHALFKAILEVYPDDGPARYFLGLSESRPANADGVVVVSE